MMARPARLGCILLALCCLGAPARALPPQEKDWEIDVSVYGWLASLHTKVEVGDVQTDIDESVRDILGDLGWAVMGGVEGRYRRALFAVDVMGMQIATDATGDPRTRDFTLPGGADGTLAIGGYDVHTRLTEWMLDVKPGFRVLSIPVTDLTGGTAQPEDRRRLDVDAFLGFRYWNITDKTGVQIDPASLTVGGEPVDLPGRLPGIDHGGVHLPGDLLRNGTDKANQATYDWVDPLLGARVAVDVTKRWSVFARGDVGGFGIGNASDLTWQGMLGSQFRVADHASLTAGYRALGIERDGPVKNTILYGPQIGVLLDF